MTTPQLTQAQALELHDETQRTLVAALGRHLINHAEVPLAATLVAKVNTGHPLSTDEARTAWRLLWRNSAALQAAGLQVPAVAAVAPQPPPAQPKQHFRVELAIRNNTRSQGKAAYNQHIVVARPPFEANGVLKATAHAEWDRVNRWFHTPATPAHAHALMLALKDFNPLPSPRVAELAAEFESLERRRAVLHPDAPEPDFPTGHLVNGQLWGHQMRAVPFAASSSASLLAVPMGGGKTAAAIATANEVDASRVVIVCPNRVRGVWPREIAKWSVRSWHIVDGTRPGRTRGSRRQDLPVAERLAQAEQCLFDCPCGAAVHAAVFNYEVLVHQPMASWRAPVPIDVAIYDEVHRAKAYGSSGMSANLARWVDFTHRRIGLSGTPMPQDPWDIFGVYRVLDPGIFGSVWTPFKGEWVEMGKRKEPRPGKGGMVDDFPKSIKREKRLEFAEKVRSIMYRPTVDLNLPAVTHYVRRVELEPDARREYERLAQELWADLSGFTAEQAAALEGEIDLDAMLAQMSDLSPEDLALIGADAVTLTPKNVLSRMLRLMQYTGGTVPDDEGVMHRVSRAKAEELMEFRMAGGRAVPVGGILYEAGCYPHHPGGVEPVCVYAHFRADLDAIREVAQRAGLRYAEISGRRSDGLTDTSEMTPDADVVAVQIQAGGTGVDLTRSCVGVWYSKGHSVGNYDQALARQHRPGQTRPVRFVHIEAIDTIDHDVYRSLMGHRAVVAGVLAIHGANNRALGGDDDPLKPEDVDTVMIGEGEGGPDFVRLPIDEFGSDVMGDPRPPREPQFTAAQREQLSLDDIL